MFEKYVKRIGLAGALKYMILEELEKKDKLSGYRILENIKKRGFDLDAGSLYNSMKGLEEKGFLKKESRNPHKERQMFYCSITEEGKIFKKELQDFYGRALNGSL